MTLIGDRLNASHIILIPENLIVIKSQIFTIQSQLLRGAFLIVQL